MLLNLPSSSYWPTAMLFTILYQFLALQVHGLAISYCSPENNAGSFPVYSYIYQSNGECQGHCQGSYAFAVLQGENCWCSNYIPLEQVSTSDCNQQCPGFPDDWCGSTDAGLYGYYLLGAANPLGTSSGIVASDSTTASSPSTRSSTTRGSSTSTSSSAASQTPTEIYTSITTVTGEVRTVVITPSSTATSDATLGQSSTGGAGGVNTGKVVGIVLGVVLGISVFIGVAVWLWFRRRRQHREQASGTESTYTNQTGEKSPSNNIPSRQVSQLSSSGLLGTKAPRINTQGMTPGNDPRSANTASSAFDRRSVNTDARLNPYALYIHDESRLSDVSLQDNQDYSRQLRVGFDRIVREFRCANNCLGRKS
ncbi:uncharacterized protein A1O9_03435 [Exophiala aquamarina CBS 119918]|uniref:WSC domain-containing protein n=1 Tax=Exophiala aquamarina CBS 119918 TaxID=1182545 RepID=A0A072PP50_9EURO|nr:uncharacterized protein A1O9_03435 [Exophiala aquamarina CBS 119918]KEF61864.1 hypothetical protein A1O9_03435 [Exophiala aquamarina CBS 119918]